MATEVSYFNFFAKDLAQMVMGKTRPGSHDIVYVQPASVSSDLIHFHENSHRSLNSATTVGKYLSALAIAADRRADAERSLRDAVRSIATLCLYTHEGYATAMQEILAAEGSIKDESLDVRLPELYVLARDRYLAVCNRLAQAQPAQDYLNGLACEESVCRVMSIAAMSVPLAGVMSAAAKLPSYAVLKQIERDAPDVRLQKLSDAWTIDLVGRAQKELEQAANDARAAGTSRFIDECLNRLAADLCCRAGLEFESPDSIKIGLMCEKMGVPGIYEHDGRDTPLYKRAVLDSISIAFAPTIPLESRLTWRSACELVRHIVDAMGVTPDAVVEILSVPQTSESSLKELALVSLHLYTDKQSQLEYAARKATAGPAGDRQLAERTLQTLASAKDNAAFLFLRLDTGVAYATLLREPETIAQGFPHESLTWVALEENFQKANGRYVYPRVNFEKSGRLVFPYLQGLTGLETYSTLYAVPAKVELPAVPEGDLWEHLKTEAVFNTELGLLFLKTDPAAEDNVLPVVYPSANRSWIAQAGKITVADASYLNTCLCHSLVTGVYAEYLDFRSKGGSSNE